jgi:hypothetical protein
MFDATEFTAGSHPVERRAGPRRRRVLLHGKVLSVTNSLTSDCMVRNLSESGARFTLKDATAYPSGFILVVIKTGMAHEVTTVWSRHDERGVRFDASHDLSRDPPTRLNHAYRLWIENLPR